jgi:Cu(I)/Ag(I) efflux system membrane fusion protein
MTEILAGLKGGERVVASGQFLIDSEANLSGALERLNAGAETIAADDEAQMPPEVMPGMPEMAPQVAPAVAPAPVAPPKAKPAKPSTPATSTAPSSPTSPSDRQCQVLYWYDPMVPDKHFDKPGKSPFMEMQLVPMFAPDSNPNCTVRDVPAVGRPS